MRSLIVVLALLFTVASFAQQPSLYRLERIVVAGPTGAEDIVRAEARLEEEQSYTEEDFRQAVYRVRRLPFVADAAWRIEPGLTAGSTTLVIQIVATSPVFYDVDTRSEILVGNDDYDSDSDAVVGGRLLLGELGTFEGVLGARDGLGGGLTYRAYDLLGRGGFATASINYRHKTEGQRHDPNLALSIGWPLSRQQSVIATVSREKSRFHREDTTNDVTLTDRDTLESASLRWWFESTDDPNFARRGTSVSAGPIWSRAIRVTEVFDTTEDEIVGTETWAERFGLGADLTTWRPLTARNAGFLRLRSESTTLEDMRFLSGEALVGIAHDFHTPDAEQLQSFRARIELGAGYRMLSVNEPGLDHLRADGAIAEGAFVLRNRWGTVRLTATYSAQ
ncbi:MAG TPA: hypothetical protein VGQ76_25820 [Thermoanaerobaculia bacterium]|jgi:hypothetical protein|nr:hypothetical protein [Thermoanaerobaculia bacterium]